MKLIRNVEQPEFGLLDCGNSRRFMNSRHGRRASIDWYKDLAIYTALRLPQAAHAFTR
jgi:hypothetical protein